MFRQVLVGLVSSATLLSSGMTLGFPGIIIPQLTKEPENLSQDEISWFESMNSIAGILGCLTCGPLLDAFGRRRTLLLVNVPLIVGWLTYFMTPTPSPIYLLYIARVLNGFGGGMASVPARVYCGEMVNKTLRSILMTWPSISGSLGTLIMYFLSWLIQDSWHLVAGISAIFPVVTVVLVFAVIQESPTWLLKKGRRAEAEASFKWIRNLRSDEEMTDVMRREFDAIVQFVEKFKTSEKTNKQMSREAELRANPPHEAQSQFERLGASLSAPDIWKPLLIINIYFLFMQFSGIASVIFYSVDVMSKAGVSMDPYLATVIVGAINLVVGSAANVAHHRFGRRTMSLWSGALMTVSFVVIGLYVQTVGRTEPNSTHLTWIPLALILFYVAAASIGIYVVPWAMLGEVFPVRIKGLASGLSTCLAYAFQFASVKVYPSFVNMFESDKSHNSYEGLFYLYGSISCTATLFVLFFLPETFKKSLDEISDEFMKSRTCQLQCCSQSANDDV
ncbi:facilitated trehalose transporter Tret1-2 homolog [Periplaneta americana]|uniref:facilitated trehalose transporter Tret1-2 homolog n=1 Tax=Periplaneta americana TaxID=6978 RepID=UPI0037E93FB0